VSRDPTLFILAERTQFIVRDAREDSRQSLEKTLEADRHRIHRLAYERTANEESDALTERAVNH
jgi:hypothetical protein